MGNTSNVVYVGSDIEANYVASILKDNGIECYTRNRLYQSAIAGWVDGTESTSTEVSVNEEDEEKALRIIDNYEKEK
ncbi:MAG: DUF2007 domain-containing protein [Bacteroidales bacterium]|nr:DUF2007 domain-containing protein [Bacteroidales bacterium]